MSGCGKQGAPFTTKKNGEGSTGSKHVIPGKSLSIATSNKLSLSDIIIFFSPESLQETGAQCLLSQGSMVLLEVAGMSVCKWDVCLLKCAQEDQGGFPFRGRPSAGPSQTGGDQQKCWHPNVTTLSLANTVKVS